MNLQATQSEDQPAASSADRLRGMRFTHPSGSKPLSGYTIKRGIGRGGFGEVYYAVSDGGKEVALKLIRRNYDIELRGVAHCLNLKHPNLLGLYDVRTDGHDDHWVVMEYVTGESLEDVTDAHPNGMPEDEANAWIHGIAEGVGYLHECGIVHRDLKPGNIFSDQGLVKIGDYGLSKFISCSRRSGQTESVGTVHYMAPEIANGRYGKEIDIYALGIMLYEMLTGHVPFEGESVGEVLMKHLTAEPDLSALSEPYRSIVQSCLAKDPEKRYESVQQLIADLPKPDAATSRIHHQPRVSPVLSELRPPAAEPVEAEIVAPPSAEPVYTSPSASQVSVPEEPIWRWMKSTFSEIGYAWNHNLNTLTKVVLILVGLWVFLTMSTVIIPVFMLLAFVYLIYRAVWTLATWSPSKSSVPRREHVSAKPQVAVNNPADPARAAPPAKPRRRRWHAKKSVPALPVKAARESAAELSGSMVIAGIVCLVISVVMLLLRGEIAEPEQYVWLALASTLGAWGVLVPAKFWEGRQGEPALRRFTMLVIGLAVGAAACGLQQALWVSLPHEFTVEPVFASGTQNLEGAEATVELIASTQSRYQSQSYMTYLSYFGFLFLLVRWWKLAEPLRTTRISLWATALCVTWAGALYMFWPFPASWNFFPQPWGFMLAATIAIAVQLASPWINTKQRQALQRA